MAFLDPVGADLSTGGTASASTFNPASVTPDKAFDKDTGTSWANAGSDVLPYLQYDHGAPVDVAQIRINLGTLGSFVASEGNIRWSVSDDGATWSTPAPVRLVDGAIAANTEATYALVQRADITATPVGADLFASTPTLSQNITPVFFPDGGVSYRDFEFGGSGRIAGTVKEDGSPDVPVKRRVRLHRERDGLLVREVWSDPVTGAYSFDYIDATKRYTVIAYDHTGAFEAVVAAGVVPDVA